MKRYSIIALIAGIVGCEPINPSCTEQAVASVQLQLRDDAGEMITDASVSFSAAGIAEEDCERIDDVFVCGWEVEGQLDIHVEADGFEPQDFSVDVDADECHVITESITRTLEPVTCTEEVVPSVLVDVVDVDTNEGLPNAEVSFRVDDGDVQSCTGGGPDGSPSVFVCGEEQAGDFEIVVEHIDYTAQTISVSVDADECHVITEEIEARLESMLD